MGKETPHALYGPSSLDALSLCVRFKYNDSDLGAADEGTMLHKSLETGDLTGLDEEQSMCVTAIRNYCESLKYEDGAKPEEWEDYAEYRLELRGLTFGTADRILFHRAKRLLHVIDGKFTRLDKSHLAQLRTYGAAFAESRPGEVDRVVTHVVAPRLGKTDVDAFDAETLIRSVRGEIEALYARIDDPFEPPTPHEDLCGKCARAAKCPMLGRAVVAMSRGLGLPLPEVFAPDSLVSVRDRAVAQALRGIFENWSEQVNQNNTLFVEQGGEIPGFRLQRRSTGLRIPKDRAAEALAILTGPEVGLSNQEAIGCCNVVVGDVVSAIMLATGLPESEAKESARIALAGIAVDGSCRFLQKEKRVSDTALLTQITS